MKFTPVPSVLACATVSRSVVMPVVDAVVIVNSETIPVSTVTCALFVSSVRIKPAPPEGGACCGDNTSLLNIVVAVLAEIIVNPVIGAPTIGVTNGSPAAVTCTTVPSIIVIISPMR